MTAKLRVPCPLPCARRTCYPDGCRVLASRWDDPPVRACGNSRNASSRFAPGVCVDVADTSRLAMYYCFPVAYFSGYSFGSGSGVACAFTDRGHCRHLNH
jgi:hypothetical protein